MALPLPVDLVTLDDLSAEAMLESSQRIDHLAELARTRLPPLSDPGPPSALPPPSYGPNIFTQMYALLLRTLIYSQPWTLTRLLRKIVISASLSILLGAIFWDIAGDSNLYLAALFAGIVIGEMTLAGGVALHLDNLPSWYQKISPMQWSLSLLLPRLHRSESMSKLANFYSRASPGVDIQ